MVAPRASARWRPARSALISSPGSQTLGSDRNRLNNYICPSIWCIKDNIAITPFQLVENNFKCFICQGGIIDTKKKNIGDATVLLRRGKSNNYWGEKTKINSPGVKNNLFDEYIEDVRESKKYKESSQSDKKKLLLDYKKKWDENLKGIEKSAYPSFMDPKLHPNSSCMICCNANQSKISKKDSTTRKVIKNIVISGCIAYPIYFTCFDNISWGLGISQAYERFQMLSAQSKGYLLYIVYEKGYETIYNFYEFAKSQNFISPKDYLSQNYNWFIYWFKYETRWYKA